MGYETGPLEISDGHDELSRNIRLYATNAKIKGACEPLICEFEHGDYAHTFSADEALAFARLFKAAPDLLAACWAAVSAANELGLSSADFPREAILATIANAESSPSTVGGR